MKNIHQIIKFGTFQLLDSDLDEETKKLMNEFMVWTQGERTKEEIAHKRLEIHDKLPTNIKEEVKKFGSLIPADIVEVHMKLGSLLFDMYSMVNQRPKAPLAAALWGKKIQELASVLDGDEFEPPLEVLSAAKQVLGDDRLWSNMNVAVWAELPPQKDGGEPIKIQMTVNEKGANFFQHVISAAVAAVMGEENGGKTEQVPAG